MRKILFLFCLLKFIIFQPLIQAISFFSVAWLTGWALILEYTIGGAAVARGISPNLV